MAIAVVFEFSNESVEKYEQVFELGGSAILDQPNQLQHVCYRTETGFTVVDVWKDEESFAAFGETLMPIIAQLEVDAKPQIFPVQGLIADGIRTI
jgi:heme-degrading monooxygenase HmoA